jgi:uncharacterized membrane protein YebE (DUF533 family)
MTSTSNILSESFVLSLIRVMIDIALADIYLDHREEGGLLEIVC